jgi:acetyl esterase
MSADEGVLDPWVATWLAENPLPPIAGSPELLALARGPFAPPSTREFAAVVDEEIEGVPVRVYRPSARATGLLVYLHGGGWCIGGIDLMDNVARELGHFTGTAVVSVGYRLAPEHPFPAGLDDCERVVRWALTHTDRFGVRPDQVLVAGESAGGNLAAAVTLRLRGAAEVPLAGQILIYPVLDSNASAHPSREEFIGIVVTAADGEFFWSSYTAGRPEVEGDPAVVPLRAPSLAGLPPALLILGGCDFLRDEGRAYAQRLRADGVPTVDLCYPGQPHGFMNLMFPAAGPAYEQIGSWARDRLGQP